jgi:mannose-6-phosphate isomerase-like protein (cupin superfamily)
VDLCSRPSSTVAQGADRWAAAASRALHPSRAGQMADWLWAVASGLASVSVPWDLRDRPDPTHPGELILATETYEAWALSWAPATVGEWHHHETRGALCVVSGELEEAVAGADGRHRRRVFSPGRGTIFGPGERHRIANLGPTPVTSVHVYTTGSRAAGR